MRAEIVLYFLEAKMKNKFDGSGKYPVAVFYDSGDESLVKPFVQEDNLKLLNQLKSWQRVKVDLDIYDGKNGMVCRLNGVETIKD